MTDKKKVLILCTGNSARSQMAEGLLRSLAGDEYDVESAGTIASFVRSQAIVVMKEIGIDISTHRSKCLDEFLNQTCPTFPGKAERIHWSFDDPAEAKGSDLEQLAVFRRVRDEIRRQISKFLTAIH